MPSFRLLVALLTLGLAACTHSAIAPLSDPQGRILAIEIPGARYGQTPSESTMEKTISQLSTSFDIRGWPLKYFPDFDLSRDGAEVVVAGQFGDMRTRSGRRFVGCIPLVALRSNRSAEETENALREVVADVHRNARRAGMKTLPITELQERPENDSP
jgi:hypothetical protein